MKKSIILLLLFVTTCTQGVFAWTRDYQWLKEHYTFEKKYVTMRDGVQLFTMLCIPRDSSTTHPILFERTPYGCSRDSMALVGCLTPFAKRNYIIVYQDVRGKGLSGGDYVNMRPLLFDETKIDEGTDTWDTVDWLLKNCYNNGKVGMIGTSYPGFYAAMGALCGHPAIKAVMPQAPCYDWFMGDDFHHNGALMLFDSVDFIKFFSSPRHKPQAGYGPSMPYAKENAYDDYLKLGAVKNINEYYGDSIIYWKTVLEHPDYDEYWQSHALSASCRDSLTCAVMVLGGSYDAEDCYGSLRLFERLREVSPNSTVLLTMGPWYHGSWYYDRYAYHGNLYLGEDVYSYYAKERLMPFFNYYLLGEGDGEFQEASMFFTGENVWRDFEVWSPADCTSVSYYLQPDKGLSTQEPTAKESCSSYLSDNNHPVPFTAFNSLSRDEKYLIEDQRFASEREDVLCFTSEVLTDTLRIAGRIGVDLSVSITGTDADFIVKVIDVFPDDFEYSQAVIDTMKAHNDTRELAQMKSLKGYQFPVRMDVFRGKYRNSFSNPEPFVPQEITPVDFELNEVTHTFLPGHRISVQIQSTWFPLVDRNPQIFTNIYTCDEEDFVPCIVNIYHQQNASSRIVLPVWNP